MYSAVALIRPALTRGPPSPAKREKGFGGRYHTPVFGIESHGSAGDREPSFWISSIEILSGVRTKAIWPSRGGRLMVTPAFINFSQKA